MNPKFKIAEVAIEINEDGTTTFWAYNIGYHPGQGGMEFGWGNFGTGDLEDSLSLLKCYLLRDIDELTEMAKEKTKKIKEKEKEKDKE